MKRKQEYVVEYGDGEVYKRDGSVVIITAKSKDEAADIACEKHGFGGGDWDIRVAGDEPHIEVIEQYAAAHYEIGLLDREIRDLRVRRDELVASCDQLRMEAYRLPKDEREIGAPKPAGQS